MAVFRITTYFLLILSSIIVPITFSLSDFDYSNLQRSSGLSVEDELHMEELPAVHTAFVQTGAELHYFSETTQRERELFTAGSDAKAEKFDASEEAAKARLEFSPSSLHFGQTQFGEARVESVSVCNRASSEGVSLDGVLSDSVFSHSSFFERPFLRPSQCARLTVAFLPRKLGIFRAPLLVHTSIGVFSLQTEGETLSNPERVPPFFGSRVAVNGTLRKELVIHNPHPHPLRILEIASSGGGLFVQPPSNLASSPPPVWDLRPFESRAVASILLVGREEVNASLFLLVKSELEVAGEGTKISLPPLFYQVPFEVVSTPDVYPSNDVLDFGTLRFGERSQQLTFSAYSTIGKHLDFEVKKIVMEPEDTSALYLEFASHPPIIITSPRVGVPGVTIPIVKVQVDTSWLPMNGSDVSIKRFFGRITATSKTGKHNVSIPYTFVCYSGSLLLEDKDGCVHEGVKANSRHSVRIRSRLPFPVAVYNLSLPEEGLRHFTLRMFERVVVLRPGEMRPLFLLKYNRKAPPSFLTHVTLYTNVSTFDIPIQIYDGRLDIELHSAENDLFDFGLIERNDSRVIRFEVRNRNPASVTLNNLRLPFPEMTRLFVVHRRKLPTPAKTETAEEELELPFFGEKQPLRQAADVRVPPGSAVLFELLLRVPLDAVPDKLPKGELRLQTDFEERTFPIHYEVASGRLIPIPARIKFGKTHPGKVSFRTLQVFNSFEEDMEVSRLSSLSSSLSPPSSPSSLSPSEPWLLFEDVHSSRPSLLRSGRLSNLGRILLMPPLHCLSDYCYLGLKLHTPVGLPSNLASVSLTDGQWFAHGLTLPANLADIDAYLYRKARARFDALVAAGRHRVNSTLVLDTTRAKHLHVPVTGELVWPRLLTRNSVHFPLTALGNFTIVNLTLTNPSSEPVIVQLIPLVIYPDAEAVVDAFREHLLTPLTPHVEMNETLMFSLRDTELFTLKNDSPVPRLREELEKELGMGVPKFTLSTILQPHAKIRIRLGFLPSDYILRSSLLIIRNNLTMVEPVVVYGRGARIGVEVEGLPARGRKPLLFEIRHDHLDDCDNPKRLMHRLTSTLTVRRPFAVHNTGEVPFSVVNMSINNFPCENRGFRILNCFPFRLQPNETYNLEVAYTPDFLSTTNEADLQLYMFMNGSAWVFPVAATVPAEMLSRCHAALPRPPFEHLMYYSCVTALVFCLICMLACAYLEGDRAIVCAIRTHYAVSSTPFDLNSSSPSSSTLSSSASPGWKAAGPASLQAAQNAPFYSRLFYQTANIVVSLVHRIWRMSLIFRRNEESPRLAEGSRRQRRRRTAPPTEKEAKSGFEPLAASFSTQQRPTIPVIVQSSYEATEEKPSDVAVEMEEEEEEGRDLSRLEKIVDGGREGEPRKKVSAHQPLTPATSINGSDSGHSFFGSSQSEETRGRKDNRGGNNEKKKSRKKNNHATLRKPDESEKRIDKEENGKGKKTEKARERGHEKQSGESDTVAARLERRAQREQNARQSRNSSVASTKMVSATKKAESVTSDEERTQVAKKTGEKQRGRNEERYEESEKIEETEGKKRGRNEEEGDEESEKSDVPEWEDVVDGFGSAEDDFSSMADASGRLFSFSRDEEREKLAETAGGLLLAMAEESEKATRPTAAIGSEKKKKEEERRTHHGLNNFMQEWPLPPVNLPLLDYVPSTGSVWPNVPRAPPPSLDPPPGFEGQLAGLHSPLAPSNSPAPASPSLNSSFSPLGLFSREHFAPWGDPLRTTSTASSDWDEFLRINEDNKKE